MDGTVTQGPAITLPSRKPKQVSERFRRLMGGLRKWRCDDHEDNITFHRSEVIDLIEGVDALVSALDPFAALTGIRGGTPDAEKFKALIVYMMEHNKPGEGADIIYQFTTACLAARDALAPGEELP